MKVAWCPTEKDKFLTYSNNAVNLYQTRPIAGKAIPKGSISLAEDRYANPLASLSDIQLLKCVAWYPGETTENLIAVAHDNGKVILSNFDQKPENDLVGKEFVPKHLRHCSYLCWNRIHTNLKDWINARMIAV